MTLGIIVRDGGGTARTISDIVVRDGTNTQRTISEIWVRDTNNTPRLVFNPSGSASLAVSVSPDEVSGFSAGTGIATTLPVTATASGGTAPYTYSWNTISWTSTDSAPFVDDPTSATTTFTQSGIPMNSTVSAVFTGQVTDDDGNVAVSDQFTAYFSDSI